MFVLVSVRHVGANPVEHQYGVSIQISISLGKTFLRISRIRNIPLTWIFASVFVYVPPFPPRFWTISIEQFWFLFWSILNGVTPKTSNTHEMISTKSERKPLKSTIWLTDQITRKFKNRSLQNFQTCQFTSLSLRKQQHNGLNGTVKSLNCFLTWEEKWSFVVFCWLAKFIAKKVCCVVLRLKCRQKWRLGCSR